MSRTFLLIGAINGFLTVAIGAFGAHALRGHIEGYYYDVFQTGVQYQGLHALALLIGGLLCLHHTSAWVKGAGWLFLAGIVLFSGSLYLLALTGSRPWGIITPIGGLCFLAGWVSFGIAAWRITKMGQVKPDE
ncbi:MAG: DUF423 domain-containing protein [Chromatiales bacterium]|nr:DUF423 domain-containing protein [Chromatiales bacterium]